MAQPGPVFTAAEVVRAGLQAEADGRLDYAVQFFRHLTDHHPLTPEAVEARAGLQRISLRRGETLPAAPAHAPIAPQQAPGHPPAGGMAGSGMPNGSMMPRPSAGSTHAAASPQSAPASSGPHPVRGGQNASHSVPGPAATASRGDATVLPAPERRYRIGQFLASIIQIIGSLIAIAGLAVIAVSLVLGGGLPFLPGRGSAYLLGPGLILLGAVLVFWGQLAGAIFDTADAARDLARIERLRAEKRSRR